MYSPSVPKLTPPQPLFFATALAGSKKVPSGTRWLPWSLPLVLLIAATYLVISNWNLWLYAIWLGWFLVVLGVALTSFYSRTSSDAMWISIAMVSGSGIGILFPSLHTASELIAGREDDEEKQRRAVTNAAWFHYLGKAGGVAVGTCVFENRLFGMLDASEVYHEYAREYANVSVALLVRIRATPGGEGSPKVQIADMYAESLKSVWILLAVLAGVALLGSCFMMPRVTKASKDAEMENMNGGYVV